MRVRPVIGNNVTITRTGGTTTVTTARSPLGL